MKFDRILDDDETVGMINSVAAKRQAEIERGKNIVKAINDIGAEIYKSKHQLRATHSFGFSDLVPPDYQMSDKDSPIFWIHTEDHKPDELIKQIKKVSADIHKNIQPCSESIEEITKILDSDDHILSLPSATGAMDDTQITCDNEFPYYMRKPNECK